MSRKIREVPTTDFQEHFLALIDEVVETGEEIVLTKDGKAVAKALPMRPVPSLEGSILYQGDLISPVIDWPEEE